MRDGYVAEHRRDHFESDEITELLRRHAAVIHRPQDDERIRNPLAETDEDIADEQFAQRGREGFDDGEKSWLVGRVSPLRAVFRIAMLRRARSDAP